MSKLKLYNYKNYFFEKLLIKSDYRDTMYFLIIFGTKKELFDLKELERKEINELKEKYKILNKKRGN